MTPKLYHFIALIILSRKEEIDVLMKKNFDKWIPTFDNCTRITTTNYKDFITAH